MTTTEKIISVLSEEGPLLPVELASKTEINSFLIKGYLEELVKEGKIKRYNKKRGSDPIFFLPGQESKIKEKDDESKEAVVKVRNYRNKQINDTPELQKKREEFIRRLRAIEEREKRQVKEDSNEPKEEKVEDTEQVIENKPEKTSINEEQEGLSFFEISKEYLDENEISIIEKIEEKKKSKEFIGKVPSKLYSIKYLIILKDKKKINKSDLALAYTKSLKRKMPVLILTPGKITKTGKEYLEDVGEFVKIKNL